MGDDGISLGVDLDIDGGGDALRLDAVLGRLDKTLGAIDLKLDKIGTMSGAAARGHKKHGDEAKGLQGALDRLVHAGIDPFLHKAKEIAEFEFIREGTQKLLELPGELADKIKELGEEMFATAGKAQRMEASFDLAFGAEKGDEMLGYIDKLSKVSPLAYDQLEELGLRLGKFGFQGREAGKALEAVSDLGALSGDPARGADEALSAIERIKSTGRIEGRALRPFGIDEKTMYAELSKETGVGMKQIKKQLEAGKIDIDATLNSLYTVITQKTGKALGGAGADMSQLFEFRLARLKDLPERYFRGMAKSPALKVLGDKFGEIFDLFNPKGEQGVKIMSALESAATQFANALGEIDINDLGDTIADTIGVVGTLASGVASLVGIAVSGLQNLEDRWLYFKSTLGDKGAEQELGHRQFERKVAQDTAAGRALQKAPGYDEDMADLESAARSGALGPKAMADEMKNGTKKVEEAGRALGRAAHRGTRKELQIQSPSRVFADLGEMTSAGFVEGIDANSEAIDRAVERMFGVAKPSMPKGAGLGVGANGGPMIGEINISVHVNGGDQVSGDDLASEVRKAVEEVVPGTLQSAFEQLAMQTGSTS